MFRARTIIEQILPVLGAIRRNAVHGVPTAQSCHIAIRTRAKELGVTYQTIVDGMRRRLGLSDISEFHRLVEKWLDQGSSDLKDRLLGSAEAAAHEAIEDFFKNPEERPYPAPAGPAHAAGLAEPLAGREARATSITIEGLDPDVLAGLRVRASRSHRTLDEEIRAILTQVARSDRAELATWSAGIRLRLRGRYQGDATAEIRADRQR